jgi:hypothetical protein
MMMEDLPCYNLNMGDENFEVKNYVEMFRPCSSPNEKTLL